MSTVANLVTCSSEWSTLAFLYAVTVAPENMTSTDITVASRLGYAERYLRDAKEVLKS